ncbi:MAG: J domain-containing protein [Deltaproteobacteria bacterium]|nr:J domain-containing protein [Deltaproteobacteria bacterium]
MASYPNYYALLGVEPGAVAAAIRRAYRERMLKCRKHPDLGGSNEEAILLNEAYEVLKDPARRAAYDRLFLGEIATTPPREDSPPPGSERRRSVRLQYMGRVYLSPLKAKTQHLGQCRDISSGGLSLRTLAILRSGERFTIAFDDDPGLAVEGSVRWQRMVPQRFGPPIYEGGVEFTDMNLPRFQAFCSRLGLAL